jgi:hypothetical protein
MPTTLSLAVTQPLSDGCVGLKALIVFLVLALLAGGGLWFWSIQDGGATNASPAAGTPAEDRRIPVRLATATPQRFETVLESLGTAQANESVTITASVTANVSEIGFVMVTRSRPAGFSCVWRRQRSSPNSARPRSADRATAGTEPDSRPRRGWYRAAAAGRPAAFAGGGGRGPAGGRGGAPVRPGDPGAVLGCAGPAPCQYGVAGLRRAPRWPNWTTSR